METVRTTPQQKKRRFRRRFFIMVHVRVTNWNVLKSELMRWHQTFQIAPL